MNSAENGDFQNQLPPARMSPNKLRVKVPRSERELREPEIEREEHGVTAFTEDQRCGNGGRG